MGLHADALLVSLLDLMHLGVAFDVLVVDRAGRVNNGSANHFTLYVLRSKSLLRQARVDQYHT